MAEIELDGSRGLMPVYVAEPDADGPWPGVVVIHDAVGMSTDLRNQADWLAGAGYLAAAPDLFYCGGRARCLFTTIREAPSFLNDHDASEVPTWAVVIDKLTRSGSGYVESSAMDARGRIVAFFDQHLKSSPPEAGDGATTDARVADDANLGPA